VRVEELSEVSPSSPATGEGVSPHRLSRLLAGDLDAIVMKALAKDAAQRYGSVGQLADDIRRHLHNEPVGARPLTAGYALAKFARRHRIGTAFTATVTTVAFIALIVINALAHQAAHEAMRAKWLKGILRPLLSFDESDFLDTRREDLRLPQLLAKCVDLVEAEPPADPKTEAEIREILGLSYRALGQYRDAERQMDRVYEICEGELGPASERLLDVKLRYAVVIEDVGREEEAGRMLQEVYEARRLTLGAADPALLRAALMLVVNLKKRNLVAECQSLAEQTLATALEAGHRDSEIVGELEERLAWCHAGAYRDDTETLYQDAIRIARLRREPNDGKVLRLQNNLADFYLTMDRAAEAEPLLQRAWAAVEVQSGRTHPRSSLTLLSNIAKCRYYLGDFAGAETLWGEVAEGRRRAATDRGDPELLKATFYHCIALNKLGRRDEAERQLRPAILLADNHKPIKALLCNALGNVLLDSGHTHEAVDELTNALSIGRGSIRDPIGLANLESDTANALLVAGERDRPRELVSAALGRLEGKLPDKHRTMVKVREILARADQVEPKENK
jgi:tetratricopeptide (TPR) repeat protein